MRICVRLNFQWIIVAGALHIYICLVWICSCTIIALTKWMDIEFPIHTPQSSSTTGPNHQIGFWLSGMKAKIMEDWQWMFLYSISVDWPPLRCTLFFVYMCVCVFFSLSAFLSFSFSFIIIISSASSFVSNYRAPEN